MLSAKLIILLFVIILFCYSKSNDSEVDYEDNSEFEDCEYVIDFKIYKKNSKTWFMWCIKNSIITISNSITNLFKLYWR